MEGLWVVCVKALPVPATITKRERASARERADIWESFSERVKLPLRAFRCCTAFRRTVSLSSFWATASPDWQAGIMADSSSMRLFILSLRRFSIWLWGFLQMQSGWWNTASRSPPTKSQRANAVSPEAFHFDLLILVFRSANRRYQRLEE